VLALVIYALVTSMGMLLFKRTGQQNSQLGHVIHGFAGAIVGLIFGVFVLWLILASVRRPWPTRKSVARRIRPTLIKLRLCMLWMCDDVFSRSQMRDLRRLPHRWLA
jgi:hypothetical protein